MAAFPVSFFGASVFIRLILSRVSLHNIENIIALSTEKISEGVARITEGNGVDIVIDSVGGNLTGDAIML